MPQHARHGATSGCGAPPVTAGAWGGTDAGGIPVYDNQRSEWDAALTSRTPNTGEGCSFLHKGEVEQISLDGDVLVALLNKVGQMHLGGVAKQHPVVLIPSRGG